MVDNSTILIEIPEMNIYKTKSRKDFKLFGIVVFSVETDKTDTEHNTELDIIVKQDYFESEFEIKKPSKEG